LSERLTEPNSGLGKAIRYLLKYWGPLTLFLRQEGAPLDNNICERALKRVVLHRKNALFYKTMHGAEVGDLFMSLIHTCALNAVNAFDYLTQVLRNPVEVAADPVRWLPWNYASARRSAGACQRF
jgi:transposase